MKKILYVLLDGVGDRPVPRLGGLTPLEAAKTPNLDALAAKSVFGTVQTVGKGMAPESDVAVFHMLGYGLEGEYPGRGVIESIGAGMDFRTGDVALRANFATADASGRILDRRAGRNVSEEEGRSLAEELSGRVRLGEGSFGFVHTAGHRGVLLLRHPAGLGGKISNTDPAYSRVGAMGVAVQGKTASSIQECAPLGPDPASARAASMVNEFTRKAYEILDGSPVNGARVGRGMKPANAVLLRDAGDTYPSVETLRARYGLGFAAVVDMPVEIGISKVVGLEVFRSHSTTDFEEKVELTRRALEGNDVVYIHLKGPDEPGHDGLWKEKTEVISTIDEAYFGPLRGRLSDMVTVVSADHATPCELASHSDDPVPLMLCNSSLGSDGLARFTERQAEKGSLGLLQGTDVLRRSVEAAR